MRTDAYACLRMPHDPLFRPLKGTANCGRNKKTPPKRGLSASILGGITAHAERKGSGRGFLRQTLLDPMDVFQTAAEKLKAQ